MRPHRQSSGRRARTNAENSALSCLYSWRALVYYARLCCVVVDWLCAHCGFRDVCRSPPQMPFFYIYHSLRRRTRFEEQQDFIFAWRSWCCCAVSMEARSNRMGTRTHARGTPGTGLYSKIVMVCAQCALRGSCLWTCSLCSWSVAACLRCHVAGVLRCHVGGHPVGRTINEPANLQPPRPP